LDFYSSSRGPNPLRNLIRGLVKLLQQVISERHRKGLCEVEVQLSAIMLNCSEMADKDESIQKLQVDKYVWSRRAKAELLERNCWNAIDPGFSDAVDDMNADQQGVNRKAYAFLLKHGADSYVEDIGNTDITKAAWEILERIHLSFTLVQTVRLLKAMMNHEKTEAQTMHEYMAQIQALNRKIAKGGGTSSLPTDSWLD